MNENEEINIVPQKETLETEVKKFADGLSYLQKFFFEQISAGNTISKSAIDASCS